ncbi:hypothetical protein FQZ97_763700 [compost metagenome]
MQLRPLQQPRQLAFAECQFVAAELEQFSIQQQAGQLQLRPAAAGDPPAHAVRGTEDELVQRLVQIGIGKARVVVEHQPARALAAVEAPLDGLDLHSRQAKPMRQAL